MDLYDGYDTNMSRVQLKASVSADNRVANIAVGGELDALSTLQLTDVVTDLLTTTAVERVDLVLAGLTFVDSSGLRCLLECRETVQRGGRSLRLIEPSPIVLRLLEVTNLLDLFTVCRESAGRR